MTVSNVWVRILVGLAFIPGIVALTWAGGVYVFGFVTLVAVVGLWEFYGIVRVKTLNPVRLPGMTAICLLCVDAWQNEGQHALPILVFFVLFSAAIEIFLTDSRSPLLNTGAGLFGVVYTGGLLSHLILLDNLDTPEYDNRGMGAVLLAFVIPWFCDTAAYFTGRFVGRHKLIPRVSAGKTVEGAIGGTVGTVLGLFALRPVLFPFLSPSECLLLGTIGSVVAQTGDLAESVLKRDAGIKDSSHIIPGHGGVLDRFDSVLFVAPCVYYYLTEFAVRVSL
ncbi:MAG: phosphatidate cytidylyltransferase [candidate division Zixibacteria bacterium]|nr:phosphatidate cytidylyltransferase [candidate division Zixibacteria bacterium]